MKICLLKWFIVSHQCTQQRKINYVELLLKEDKTCF